MVIPTISKKRKTQPNSSQKNLQAVLSKAAYEKDPEAYVRSKGYDLTLDKSLSSKDWSTFVSPSGKATIAYRGTRPTNWRDITTDVLIGLGLEGFGSRFQRADRVAQKAKEKYGDVQVTGHSLGGSLGMYAAKKNNLEAIVFNPGAPKPWYTTKKTTIYAKAGDPISNITLVSPIARRLMRGNVKVEIPKGAIWNPINNHGIGQFIKDDAMVKGQSIQPTPIETGVKDLGYSATDKTEGDTILA